MSDEAGTGSGAGSTGGVDIALEEWESVAEVVARLRPAESARVPGVVLDLVDGRRRWVVQTPWVTVRLDGDVAAAPGDGAGGAGGAGGDAAGGGATRPFRPVGLPARLVARAAELAGPSGWCRLEVAGSRAVVAGELGRATFGVGGAVHPVRERWPAGPSDGSVPAAAVAADLLVGALRDAAEVPAGVDLGGRTAPDVWLVVDGRGVAVRVDWAPFGAPAVEVGVPARTRAQWVVRVPAAELTALLEALEMEGDVRLTLAGGRTRLWVEADGWQARVTVGWLPGPDGSERSAGRGRRVTRIGDRAGRGDVDEGFAPGEGAPTLEGALAVLGLGPEESDGWRSVHVGGVVVRVGEVPGPDGARPAIAAGLAVRLAEGVEGSAEVLAELNALNEDGHGLVGVRLWWADDGAVWAGTEVERRRWADLPRVARRLARSTADLGVLVAMVGATGAAHGQVPGQLSLIDDD